MPEYFIRLATLLGTDFPEKLPVVGYLARELGVRQWRETWNDDTAVVTAEAVLEREISWEVGGFRFSVGDPAGGETVFRFEMASDRNSLLTTIADRGAEMAGITNPPPSNGLQIFARADGPPAASRFQLHDLDLRIRLPRRWVRKGRRIGDRMEPDPADLPVDVAFLGGTLVIEPDGPKPIQYILDDDVGAAVDPMYVDSLGIGIEVDNLKLDLSNETGIPEVLARPGYQESWTGLYLEKFRIYGMNALFPSLPEKLDPDDPADLIIELSKWVVGFEDGGLTGSLKVVMNTPDDGRILRGAGFELELERGTLVRCEHQLTLHVGQVGGDAFSLGPEGDLQIVASARFNPDGRLGFELALRTPEKDRGLISLGPEAAMGIQALIGAWLLIDDLRDADYTDALLLAGLLFVLGQLQVDDRLTFNRLTLDTLRIRYREELVQGRHLKWLDFIVDIELRLSLDIPLKTMLPAFLAAAVPNIRTDPERPLGILMRGMRISYAFNHDDFSAAELDERRRLEFGWPEDYFFDLADQTIFQGSPVILVKFGFGRWDRGVWIDLGLKLAVNEAAATYALMPGVVRLYFLQTGDFDHMTFEGLSLSIMIPGVMFIRGRLNLGDTVTEAALQGYFISKPGLSREDAQKRENWNWDVGAQYREATLPDGTDSTIVFAWLRTSTGIPIPLLPSTALYGGHFLYAKNARPAAGGAPIEDWYTKQEPANQIEISKWEGNPDSTGIAFGLVIGAQADRGKPWNLQVGLLYADSQWLLHGFLNLFKAHPDPANTSAGSLRLLGAWGASRLLGSVRWIEQVPADGTVMKLDLGAEILVDDESGASHFYAGFHWPPERHLKAVLLERYEAGFYLMADAADVENFAGTGHTLPGFVTAFGARFAIEGGRRKGRLKLYFYLRASADIAFTGSGPFLTVIRAAVAGGLVAKAYGIGFEFEVEAEVLWIRPEPDLLEGQIKITLDLPWPISNLSYTLDLNDGADGPTEALQELVEGLSLITRNPKAVTELSGGSSQPRVPVDPVFSLAFSYPTRNQAAVDGNFEAIALGLGAVDNQVTHETSGPYAYAVELTTLKLWRGTPAAGVLHPGPVPAKWVAQQTEAPGGQPSRRILELFSLEDVALAGFVGPSADAVTGLADGWSPCPATEPPQPICYVWNQEPLGSIGNLELVEHATATDLEVHVLPEPDGAQSSRRFFGWEAQSAEVVVMDLLAGVARALRLPAVTGEQRLPTSPSAESVELRYGTARQVVLDFIRPVRRHAVRVRFYLGDLLVKEDAEGIHAGNLDGLWEHAQSVCDQRSNRAVVDVAVVRSERQEDAAVLLARVCVSSEREMQGYQDSIDSAGVWTDFWTSAGPPDPLVLQPASHYTLEVGGNWSRVLEGNETPGGTFTRTFEFDTVELDEWPTRLRGIDQSVDGRSDYDVRTVPEAGAVAVYPSRPIRLEFRNRRIESVYEAFGRRLAIRIVDDAGSVEVDWLSFVTEAGTDLPDSEAAWQDVVTGSGCTPLGVGDLWNLPVVGLPDLLEPDRRYDATIYALAATATPATVDLANEETLHQFTFRTSRWTSLAAHLAAYVPGLVVDELVGAGVAFGDLAAAIGPSASVADDVVLASALHDVLGVPRRLPAAEPETTRLWYATSTGHALAGLLLDGPEPLPRPAGGALEVRTQGNVAIPTVVLQAASGTRSLVLFRDGVGGFAPIPPGPLRLVASDSWTAIDGTTQVDVAIADLEVPPRPPFLEPEAAP